MTNGRFVECNVRMRFEKKYLPHPATECWNWLGALNQDGYSAFWDGKRQISGHRFSYHVYRGNLLPELEIDHLCRNRRCVNPHHLEQVTSKINSERGRGALTHCSRGHLIDGLNSAGKRFCRECQRQRSAAWESINKARRKAMRLKSRDIGLQPTTYIIPVKRARGHR